MASGMIHLAVTKKISEKYDVKERNRLNFGSVLPDFSADRQKAHFRAVVWGGNKRTYDLNAFRVKFGKKILNDDLYLGYYLHLVQDVVYRHFVYDRYHWNPQIPGNVERLHNDYALLNRYVREAHALSDDITVPEGFEAEDLAGIAEFYPDGMVEAMHGFFRNDGEGEAFFLSAEMVEEFIAEAAETCLRELNALRSGTSIMDGYDLAWENPPYSLLETTRNTRELGGYRIGAWNPSFGEDSQPERFTKNNINIRSDAALEPSEKDIAFLKSVGVTTVIDVRVPSEVEARPHGLADVEGFHYFNLPIEEGAFIPESVEAVPGSYMKIAHSKTIGQIFRTMAEAEGGVIENCSAGKDRTGVISALLLWLCGVRKEDIVYDYMRTKENNRERFGLIRLHNPDIDMNIVIPRESFLTDFMDLLVAEHGTIEAYFEAIGIDARLQEKLKAKLCVEEPKKRYRYCLLDLDGTLTDPGLGITNSVMYALKKFGIEVADRSELYSFIGPPLADSFKKYYGFSDDDADRAVSYYREYFRDTGIFENAVYPGIPEALKTLKENGTVVALATSKPYEFAVRILEHFGLIQYFDYFGAATMDGRISRKSDVIAHLLTELGDVDKSETLMVGDRNQDIDGAKANGLQSVGVLWGYGSREELESAGAEYILAGPEELPKLFD